MKRIYEYLRIRNQSILPFLKGALHSDAGGIFPLLQMRAGWGAVIFFLLFAFAPFLAFAQTPGPYARYCPDPTEIFTGIMYDSNGKPLIELTVDPVFEEKMQQERKLGNLPVTPIYDLALTVVPLINEYCLPQYDKEGHLIKEVNPPQVMSGNFTPYFGLKNEILLGGVVLEYYGRKTETGERIYEWRVKGWQNGIFVSEKLEKVIKAVQENDPTLRIGVLIERPGKPVEKVEKPISFDLCVPLAGGSPHSIVHMRGKSFGFSASQMVSAGDKLRENGFEEIQPFKKYSIPSENSERRSYFAHFVDLVNHDDTSWKMLLNKLFLFANSTPKKISSCGSKASQYFFLTSRPQGGLNYAPQGNRVAFISIPTVDVAMHEMGHSFAGLEDEYHSGFDITLYYANCAPAGTRPEIPAPTTATDEALLAKFDMAPRNTDLTLLKRAYWDPYGDTIKGCGTNTQFRPSLRSLMNSNGFDSKEFNIPSCVWILKVIKGTASVTDWQECMAMDGLEKPTSRPAGGVSFSLFPFFASWFKNQMAAVAITDTVSPERDATFVNLEYFSSDGKEIRSEIYENTGTEENPSWRKVAVEAEESAETVAKQYCPGGEKDLFKGSIYEENDKPWIETVIDPEFEQKTLRGERKIGGDIPLTPVYDLVVRIKPEFNYYCIPGWAGSNTEVTAKKLPPSVPITAFFAVGEKNEAVTNIGTFTRTEKRDEQNRFIYEWHLKGWYSGIAKTDTLLKRLVTAIANGTVKLSLTIPQSSGVTIRESVPISSFGLCA
ncbi:MAG: hypothetical protein HYS57_01980, partial [Parcubacteria group bacterium]|nr:hypothetical protein [Parcubacteria group bacterium]